MNAAEREESLLMLERLRPMDDTFMRVLFRDVHIAEIVLRIIMNKEDLHITDCRTQEDMKRLGGARSICLDALATDDEGRKYDIEVQRAAGGAKPKRARYHAAVMDIEFLDAADDFEKLPESYVIFITEKDVIGDGKAIHIYERRDEETGMPLDDGQHILYINGAYQGEEPIGRLMHDFRCSAAEDMLIPELAERTRYLKENEEGSKVMCQLMEDRIYRRNVRVAEAMLEMGTNTLEQIAQIAELPLETVRELAEKKKAPVAQ